MADYDPNDPKVPIPWAQTPNAYIPELWRRRDEDYWRIAATAMSRGRTPQPPPYHEELLDTSRRLIAEGDEKKYQLAVVMAQAACEILTDQVITALIERVEPESLRAWIGERTTQRNHFANKRVRELYSALTGDEINPGEGLWQQYVTHVERRHKVVHRGDAVSKDDATHSYETARQVIDYLRAVQERLRVGQSRENPPGAPG